MGLLSPLLHPERQTAHLHWGGGTPTFLLPDEIRRLGGMITEHFNLAPDIEAGVEIDPRGLTLDHVKALRQIGFNRASLGVQDFEPSVQVAVHRVQPRDMVDRVIGWIRDEGFQSLNLDLIYGLPYQTLESFARTLDTVLKMKPDRLVVSPGPCTPNEAGISVPLIREFAGKIPILGVCLGHQSIGQAFGGKIVHARQLMHGKTSPIQHEGAGVFRGLPQPFAATRYHSLVIERGSLPDCLAVTAWTDDGEIMGVRHKTLAVEGVQFHPESILTEHGHQMLKNFLEERR